MKSGLQTVEKILTYTFQDKTLLERALTHSSLGVADYERLEFLGDRVLGLIIAEELFKKFPKEKEGLLAKRFSGLVQRETLAAIAIETDLSQSILLSDQERLAGGLKNENLLSDIVEALLGAMYMDGGISPCKNFVLKAWKSHFDEMKLPPQEPKTVLQEWAQARGLNPPSYTIIKQEGPDHAPLFTIEVALDTFGVEHAKGHSRRTAEKIAAQAFLEKLMPEGENAKD